MVGSPFKRKAERLVKKPAAPLIKEIT